MPMTENESVNISVEKIENGFIRTVSKSGPEGYESKREFFKENPGVGMGATRQNGRGSLQTAISSLKAGPPRRRER